MRTTLSLAAYLEEGSALLRHPATGGLLDLPSLATPRVQEVHACLYHCLRQEVERRIAG